MSESTTRKRIVNVAHGITGIQTYFYNIPRALQDAELPGLVVFPGRSVYDTESMSEQIFKDTRDYEAVIYVAKALFDTEGQGEIEADQFLDSFGPYFAGRPGLEIAAEGAYQSESVYDSAIIGDGGLSVGPYPISGPNSPPYIQIRWTIRVNEVSRIVYGD